MAIISHGANGMLLILSFVLPTWVDKSVGLSMRLFGGGSSDGLVSLGTGPDLSPLCHIGNYDPRIPKVICRSLGLESAHALYIHPSWYTSNFTMKAQLIALNCSETAPASECGIENLNYFCSYVSPEFNRIVAVLCTDEAPQYRLTQLNNDSIGLFEIKLNGTWGPVCTKAFPGEVGKVASHANRIQSAYSSLEVGPEMECHVTYPTTDGVDSGDSTDARIYTGLFNEANLTASLGPVYCAGTETSLEDCRYASWRQQCEDDFYLALSCADASEGKIRITDGEIGNREGPVQVYHNQQWLGVGSNPSAPTTAEAIVACNSFNFTTNMARLGKAYQTDRLWLNDLRCNGNEDHLLKCSETQLTSVQYPVSGQILAVSCDLDDEAIDLQEDGLLKLRRNGVWGTVCVQSFGNLEASVICKSYNKSSSLASRSPRANEPKRTGPIWWWDVHCNKTSNTWKDCYQGKWTPSGCNHDSDAYITCDTLDRSSVKFRLTKGAVPTVGVVEISINNVWGTICNNSFGTVREAQVLCRSLGMRTDGARILKRRYLPRSDQEKVWMDLFWCNGTESSILDCERSYLGDHHCYHRREAAVYCGPPTEVEDFTFRLYGGQELNTGRLEVMMYGEWGAICATNFTDLEAEVACRSLGLPHELARVVTAKEDFGANSDRIWFSKVQCFRNDRNLKDCFFWQEDVMCKQSTTVEIVCSDSSGSNKRHLTICGLMLGWIAFLVFLNF